jgi:hypothetical protein
MNKYVSETPDYGRGFILKNPILMRSIRGWPLEWTENAHFVSYAALAKMCHSHAKNDLVRKGEWSEEIGMRFYDQCDGLLVRTGICARCNRL